MLSEILSLCVLFFLNVINFFPQSTSFFFVFYYLGDSTTIPYFAPQSLFPMDWENYFHYPGSLTTPTCDESVSWFVDQTPLPISSTQVSPIEFTFFI